MLRTDFSRVCFQLAFKFLKGINTMIIMLEIRIPLILLISEASVEAFKLSEQTLKPLVYIGLRGCASE